MLALPYRELPVSDPGTPDTRSPMRYLWWLARQQAGTLTLAMLFGVGWMVAQALVPVAIGTAIDRSLTFGTHVNHVNHRTHELLVWSGIVLVLGLIQAVCGTYRHQLAVTNWMKGTYRSIQVVGRHLSNQGTAVTEAMPAGDVVNTVASDAMRIGGAFDVLARFVGAVVAWVVVAVVMLHTSVTLGLIALLGVPILGSLTTPLMRPLHATQAAQREAAGRLAALGADTVAGLRILRGVGGEAVFNDNYRQQSQRVRFAGNRIATPQAALESGQVLLPAVLTVTIAYLAGRDVIHHTLAPGQLVAFFGLTTFLTLPLRTSIEYVIATTRAVVGARKVLTILSAPALVTDPVDPLAWPVRIDEYRDERSGLSVTRGEFSCFVTETPAEAAELADRLGRFTADATGVRVNGLEIGRFKLADVRRHVVVSEIEPRLFSGDVRSELSPHGRWKDDDLLAALDAASALDVLDALPDGLDSAVEERGRSFSGGQRQRIALARALLSDADLLVLVEPTSAVDTHTERRIASGLHESRRGRSTLISTTSPLVLEEADVVQYVESGHVVARGTHAELLRDEPGYRRVVLRGAE